MTKIEYVKVAYKERVAYITLSHKERKNVFGYPMVEALKNALEKVAKERRAKVVVFASECDVFSDGYDYAYLYKLQQLGVNEQMVDLNHLAQLYLMVFNYPLVTVAQVWGDVKGPAATLLALSDFIFCLEEVQWEFTDAQLGLIPAFEVYLLKIKYNVATARYLFLMPEMHSSIDLARMGILYKLFTDKETLIEESEQFIQKLLTQNSLTSMQFIKRMSLDMQQMAVNQALHLSLKMGAKARLTDEGKLAIVARLKQQKLEW